MIKHIDVADEQYAENGLSFEAEFQWHKDNGWIISSPAYFGMGYFVEDDGDLVLHVSYTVGDMRSLFRFSLDYSIDFIEFKRNFRGNIKRHDFKRFEKRMNHG